MHFYKLVPLVLPDIDWSLNPTLHPSEICCFNLNTKVMAMRIVYSYFYVPHVRKVMVV